MDVRARGRQPLTAIIANADAGLLTIRNGGANLVEEPHDILTDIRSEAWRASEAWLAMDVMRRLRTLFRKQEVRRKPLDLSELTGETLRLIKSEVQRRKVTLTIELVPSPPAVEGDRVLLQQVLLNLVFNAMEAAAAAAVRLARAAGSDEKPGNGCGSGLCENTPTPRRDRSQLISVLSRLFAIPASFTEAPYAYRRCRPRGRGGRRSLGIDAIQRFQHRRRLELRRLAHTLGNPDLQGVWPINHLTGVPLRRDLALGERHYLNEQEKHFTRLDVRSVEQPVNPDDEGDIYYWPLPRRRPRRQLAIERGASLDAPQVPAARRLHLFRQLLRLARLGRLQARAQADLSRSADHRDSARSPRTQHRLRRVGAHARPDSAFPIAARQRRRLAQRRSRAALARHRGRRGPAHGADRLQQRQAPTPSNGQTIRAIPPRRQT